MPSRPITVCLCLAVSAAVIAAQSAPSSAPQQPTFRTGVQSVRVDLYATKDDRPVTDLRLDEIELFEDGVRQTIQTFERVAVAPHSAQPPPEPGALDSNRRMATDPKSRLFVLFIPASSTRFFAGPVAGLRFPLIQQLNNLLGPDDLVAVMTQNTRVADLTFQRRLPINSTALFANQFEDPKYAFWDACYPTTIPGSPNGEMKARYNELMTFEVLESLVTHLGGLREERKHVLMVTNGFRLFTKNSNLGMQMRSGSGPGIPIGGGSPIGVGPRLGDSTGGSGVSPQRQCETDLTDLASLDLVDRPQEIVSLARRNNVSIYPISPGQTTATRGRSSFRRGAFNNATPFEMQSSLRGLADNTDGIAIVNTNDVEGPLKKMMTTTSVYYLLSYTPTNTAADGKFRRISVKVRRSDIHVRARPGYVVGRPAELRASAPVVETSRPPDPVHAAVNALALARTDMVHVRPASWMRFEGTQTSGALWIVAELDGETRTAARWKNGGWVEMTLRRPGGSTAITRRVEIKGDNPVAEFELPAADAGLAPGQYAVQLEFTAANGAPVGDFVRMTMPADATPLGEPILSRRFTGPGARYVRTADPRFRRNELLRLELPTSADIPASARLLDSKGSPLPVPAQISDRPDASGAFRWIVVDLPMSPLAPAVYAVAVSQGSASQVAAFRVVP